MQLAGRFGPRANTLCHKATLPLLQVLQSTHPRCHLHRNRVHERGFLQKGARSQAVGEMIDRSSRRVAAACRHERWLQREVRRRRIAWSAVQGSSKQQAQTRERAKSGTMNQARRLAQCERLARTCDLRKAQSAMHAIRCIQHARRCASGDSRFHPARGTSTRRYQPRCCLIRTA